jgi:steroid delta-isomerase-like uncharacterized protein
MKTGTGVGDSGPAARDVRDRRRPVPAPHEQLARRLDDRALRLLGGELTPSPGIRHVVSIRFQKLELHSNKERQMPNDLIQLTLDGFERMFNRGDLAYIDEVIRSQTVDHQEAPGTNVCDHLAEVVRSLRRAFPDLHFAVDSVVADGDLVATRTTMTGTHQGTYSLGPIEAPASGREVRMAHMHFFQYEDGHLADLWHVWDTGKLKAQLGVA